MKCDDCRYFGMIFNHLTDYDGIKIWGHCEYPLPHHIDSRATPIGIEHNCLTYEAKRIPKSLKGEQKWKNHK